MTNKQTAEAFAQGKPSGTSANGTLLFANGTMYSYGGHFKIAILDHATKTAKFTRRKYSVTTAKHKNDTRAALAAHGWTIEEVDTLDQ